MNILTPGNNVTKYLHGRFPMGIVVEGDSGAGSRKNRGREGYGKREEKGREAGFPKGREPGEKEKNFAILRKVLQ